MIQSTYKEINSQKTAKNSLKNDLRKDRCNDIVELITRYKLNQLLISKHLGISLGCFSDKMHTKRGGKFTQKQKYELIVYLNNLGCELTNLKYFEK